jgi:hypothetical protein
MKNIMEYSISWDRDQKLKTSASAEFLSAVLHNSALVVVFLEDKEEKETKTWRFMLLEADGGCNDEDPEFESTMYVDSFVIATVHGTETLYHLFMIWE